VFLVTIYWNWTESLCDYVAKSAAYPYIAIFMMGFPLIVRCNGHFERLLRGAQVLIYVFRAILANLIAMGAECQGAGENAPAPCTIVRFLLAWHFDFDPRHVRVVLAFVGFCLFGCLQMHFQHDARGKPLETGEERLVKLAVFALACALFGIKSLCTLERLTSTWLFVEQWAVAGYGTVSVALVFAINSAIAGCLFYRVGQAVMKEEPDRKDINALCFLLGVFAIHMAVYKFFDGYAQVLVGILVGLAGSGTWLSVLFSVGSLASMLGLIVAVYTSKIGSGQKCGLIFLIIAISYMRTCDKARLLDQVLKIQDLLQRASAV